MKFTFRSVFVIVLSTFLLAGCQFGKVVFEKVQALIQPADVPSSVLSTSIPNFLPTNAPVATDTPAPTPVAITSLPAGTPTGIELCGFKDDDKATEQWRSGPNWSGILSYEYHGGVVLLAGSADGAVPIQDLDDALRLTVTHPDGTTAQFYIDTIGISCTKNQCELGPYDITDLFAAGTNRIKTEIIDLWPTAWGIKELWLVEFN